MSNPAISPNTPPLNKDAIIGGCARLPVTIDLPRLRAEIDALPREVWGSTAGRVAVHRDAEALFLRGYAPAEGNKPIEDRPVLERLPYAREIIKTKLGSAPLRCLLARLAGGGVVTEHADLGPYFARTIRIHVPIISNPSMWMVCGGLTYQMRPGEVWALNNSTNHAVWNADPVQARTHMICDFLPTPALLSLLARSERNLGQRRADVDAKVRAETAQRASVR
jgi:hypothetical protein